MIDREHKLSVVRQAKLLGPRLLLADKGYDGDVIRAELLIHGIKPVIPPNANRENHLHATLKLKRIAIEQSGCSIDLNSFVALQPATTRPENPSKPSLR